MIPLVHAYRDVGPMMGKMTRWQPRKVYCTASTDHSDLPGELCVVKFCKGRTGAAAMISEVVCHGLFQAAAIPVLDIRLVAVSASFAASWNDTKEVPFKPLPEGRYFGSVHEDNVVPGPPNKLVDVVAGDLVDIWVFDTLICNLDRNTEGNILLRVSPRKAARCIAADQSDCFCGSESFGNGTFAERMVARPASECRFAVDAAAKGGGGRAIKRAIDKASAALAALPAIFANVPNEWWAQAGLTAASISQVLNARFEVLAKVLPVGQLPDIDLESYGNIPWIGGTK